MRSMEELAGDLATAIVGVKPFASRERLAGESIVEQSERRRLLDKRQQVKNLLVQFGQLCVRAGKDEGSNQ